MEITGKIEKLLERREGTSKTSGNKWVSQEFVVLTNEQYPKHVCINAFGEDRINGIGLEEGKEVKVSFDIDANEYQGRWYNKLMAWKVEATKDNNVINTPTVKEEQKPNVVNDNDDNLPF